MRNRITFPIAALVALAMLVPASDAGATGFYLGEQDSTASARGLAVTAKLDTPATIFFNPAGMAFLEGIQASAGFTAVFPFFHYEDPAGKRPSADASRAPIWDPHVYATYTFGKKASIGIGFNAPFGLALDWPKGWAGQNQIKKAEMQMPTFYIGAAARPIPRLAIGVTLRIMQASITFERGFDLIDANGDPFQGGVKMSASATGFGASLGLMAQPLDWLHVGFSYTSRINLDFTNGEGRFTLPAGFDNTLFHDQKGSTQISTPDMLAIGVAFDVHKDVTLEVDYNLTMWSSYKELTVKFANDPTGQMSKPQAKNWKNVSCVRLGGEYRWNDTIAVRASFVYDETPAPDSTLGPELPDASRLVSAVGLGYKHPRLGLRIDGYYMFTYFLPREVKAPTNTVFPAKYDAYAMLFGLTLGYGTPKKPEPPAPPAEFLPPVEPVPAPAPAAEPVPAPIPAVDPAPAPGAGT